MRCDHNVSGYEWKKCSKCGKIVRVNRRRRVICDICTITISCLVAPPFADWAIRVLNLSEYNPHNITHALISCIPFFLICYIPWRTLPLYDEKDQP